MKVLVIGYQGMLAQELLPCLANAGFDVIGRGRPEVDITQVASVRQTLAEIQPTILINAAAYTAVDQAELEPDVALAVNRDGVAHLATVCRDLGIPLLHVSSDYIFDGSASHPYCEDEPRCTPWGVWPKQVGGGGSRALWSPRTHDCTHCLVVWASPPQFRQNHAPSGARARGAPGGGRPVRLPNLEPRLGSGPGDPVSTYCAGQRPRTLGNVSLLWCWADYLVWFCPGHYRGSPGMRATPCSGDCADSHDGLSNPSTTTAVLGVRLLESPGCFWYYSPSMAGKLA